MIEIDDFQATVWQQFEAGRRDMPWRSNTDPYWILVSEIMLQQTQVDRVIPKFEAFVTSFPSIQSLARSEFGDVLSTWLGLGYNRRAKYLHQTAQTITNHYDGSIPNDQAALESLPGIGANTAAAIRAYAFNQPVVFIETNIRSVFLHHFFNDRTGVPDSDLLPLVEKSLDRDRPREWYWALMDYGAELKRQHDNPARRSKHHAIQSRFAGSRRQLRGGVLRELTKRPQTVAELRQKLPDKRLDSVLNDLSNERLIKNDGATFSIA